MKDDTRATTGDEIPEKAGDLIRPLRDRLADWTDFDVAGYHLGVVLGLLPEWPSGTAWGEHKWVFWSANPLGDCLWRMLLELTSLGILERNEDSAFRWVGTGALLNEEVVHGELPDREPLPWAADQAQEFCHKHVDAMHFETAWRELSHLFQLIDDTRLLVPRKDQPK